MDEELTFLSDWAAEFKTQPAIVFGFRSISFQQLDQYVGSTAKQLKKIGIKSGDRVAIVAPNSVEQVVVLLTLWQMGAIACPVNPRFPPPLIQSLLSKLGATVVLAESHEIMSAQKITARKFRLSETINFDVRNFKKDSTNRIPAEQEATVIFTSGSSTEPKAALHTFGNYWYSARGANEHIPVVPGDRWLLSLPLYHVGGLGILFRCLLGGATIMIPQPEDDLATAIIKNKPTHLSLVPTQLYHILENPECVAILAKSKVILLGGSAIPANLIEKAIQNHLPIHTTYGLTEMASQVATSPKLMTTKPAAKVLPYRELKISQEGEILVKGKTLFKGYVEGGKLNLPLTSDGWFATGDLGVLESDGLRVTGRKDNMFISGGENIYPEEIEQALTCRPDILEALVIPVASVEFGARPVALIKAPAAPDIASLRAQLEKSIPRFKIPDAFYAWPENTENLKVSRKQLTKDFITHPEKFKKIS